MKNNFLYLGFLDDKFLREEASFLNIEANSVSHVSCALEYKHFCKKPGVFIDWNKLKDEKTVEEGFNNLKPEPINLNKISKFYECYSYFLRCFDRYNLDKKPIRKIEKYYLSLLQHTLTFLEEELKIDRIIFSSTPHFPPEIIFFFCAKYLSIPVIILRRTLLNNTITFTNDFRPGYTYNLKINSRDLHYLNTKEKIFSFAKQKSFWLNYSNNFILQKFQKEKYFINYKIYKEYLNTLFSLLQNPNQSWFWYFPLKRYEIIFYFLARLLQIRRLSQWLLHNGKKPKENEKYALFCMQFQPERTTDPESGYFSHQFESIKIFRKALPDSIPLLIKEHPRQLMDIFDLRKINFRQIEDYEQISHLPNTYFLSLNVKAQEALEKSIITASGTGSMVWEGALLGKPGILFGSSWHQDCKVTPQVNGFKSARAEVKKLLNLPTGKIKDEVATFLLKSRKNFFISANSYQSFREAQNKKIKKCGRLGKKIKYIFANYGLATISNEV